MDTARTAGAVSVIAKVFRNGRKFGFVSLESNSGFLRCGKFGVHGAYSEGNLSWPP